MTHEWRDGPPHTGPLNAETQSRLSPSDALAWLVAGNVRFVRGKLMERDQADAVFATAVAQYPFAVVLACMDSRVAPEIVFDAGIGDIFTVRIAGNYASSGVLGSLEFATLKAGAKAIVVLGHSSCATVQGALQGGADGNLGPVLDRIRPAIEGLEDFEGHRHISNPEFVQAVAEENVHRTIAEILGRSPSIAATVESGAISMVGAMHDVASGIVSFLDRH